MNYVRNPSYWTQSLNKPMRFKYLALCKTQRSIWKLSEGIFVN